jgi:hypothetical protein
MDARVPCKILNEPGGIGSLESILGLLKSLRIRALNKVNIVSTLGSRSVEAAESSWICPTCPDLGHTTPSIILAIVWRRNRIQMHALKNIFDLELDCFFAVNENNWWAIM